MHPLGKVFAWFIVLGAAGALALSARAHQVRTSWIARFERSLSEYEPLVPKVATQRRELAEAERQLAAAQRGWGLAWDGAGVRSSRRDVNNDGVQDVVLETDQRDTPGLIWRGGQNNAIPPVMYVFQTVTVAEPASPGQLDAYLAGDLSPEESSAVVAKLPSRFVGGFRATKQDGGVWTWKPNWRVRAGEFDGWQQAAGWRLRTLVPADRKNRFSNIDIDLTLADQALADKKFVRGEKQRIDSEADKQLVLRRAELTGDDLPPILDRYKGRIPDFMINGLVEAIAGAEERRNEALDAIDQLRRTLKFSRDRLDLLRQQNRTLSSSLPGGKVKVSRRPE